MAFSTLDQALNYLTANPDVMAAQATSNMTPQQWANYHYDTYGVNENRNLGSQQYTQQYMQPPQLQGGYTAPQQQKSQFDLSALFKPFQDQISQLQNQYSSLQSMYNNQSSANTSPTAGYTSGSYTNPNNLAGLYPTKNFNLNNSRGARYFNQDSNSYQTGDTGTSMASF
jgi:hypothetical protein